MSCRIERMLGQFQLSFLHQCVTTNDGFLEPDVAAQLVQQANVVGMPFTPHPVFVG
jgi:hypothetical protein